MKIKMRVNKSKNDDSEIKCASCGKNKNQVLNMFDLKIGNIIVQICDECNQDLFSKTLKANVFVNERLKSKRDIAIINKRRRLTKEEKTNGISINEALKEVGDND